MCKLYILSIGVLLMSFKIFAQDTIELPSQPEEFSIALMESQMQLPKLPEIISPTPTVAELGKYGTYPVSMNSGIPNISFPLFAIEVAEISIPFSLSYHAGGIKVNQESTEVGLGWSISGPMVIHRNVLGAPDESPNGNFNVVPMNSNEFFAKYSGTGSVKSQNYYDLKAIADGVGRDTRPDIFNYNIPGKSGQFIYAPNRNFFTFPYEPIKINIGNPSGNFSFNIVDENGTTYKFSDYNKIVIDNDPSFRSNYITDLYVKEIISHSKQDTVRFEYLNSAYVKNQVSYSQTIGRDFAITTPSSGGSSQVGAVIGNYFEESSVSTIAQEEKYIKRITYRKGEIVFNYTTQRQDRNGNGHRLNEILIYNNEGVLVKKFNFIQDYFTATFDGLGLPDYYIKRMKLVSFSETSVNQPNQNKTYSFDYNTSIPIPKIGSFAQDFWGLFNGKNNNSLIPATSVTGGEIGSVGTLFRGTYYSPTTPPDASYVWNVGSANRSVDTTKMQMGILKKITFPTKGYTTFNYEAHAYASSTGSTTYGGGLRIKKIVNYDKSGTISGVEEYNYGVNENGVGQRLFDEALFFKNYDDFTIETFEHIAGTCNGWISAWQRKYLGVDVYSAINYNGLPWVYTEVNKYVGTNSAELQKSKYLYNSITEDLATGNSLFINSSNYGQMVPVSGVSNLIEESHYRKNGSLYDPVNKIEYKYDVLYNSFVNSLLVKEVQRYVDMQTGCGYLPGEGGDQPAYIRSGQYQYKSKAYRLTQKKETNTFYLSGVAQPIMSTTIFNYDNPSHLLVTSAEMVGSDGKVELSRTYYPDDITSTAFLGGGNLTSTEYSDISKLKSSQQHRISTPIQNERWLDGVRVFTKRITYKDWGNSLVMPQIEKISTASNPMINILRYHAYTRFGNPGTISKEGGKKISYIWDYKGTLPIAKIENANYDEKAILTLTRSNEVMVQDFENYPSRLLSSTAHTGSYLYKGTYNVELRDKVTGSYILEYWGSPDGINWTRNVVNLSISTSSNSYSIGNSSTYLDNVRLYPLHSMITSFTHKPQVGQTSELDPNGSATYFEYDGLGRLVLIKDNDWNILEHYEYNYSTGN